MEQTQLLCFQPGVSVKTIKERQQLDDAKIAELNHILNIFSNNRNFNWLNVQQFNKVSGLYVNFKYGNRFYAIEFKFDGKDVFFEASFRMFNSRDYDSDDEEDINKMTSYHFVPFERLYPKKTADEKYELTLDMYFDFVHRCITMDPFYHEYKK
jgi:hypothetical protein